MYHIIQYLALLSLMVMVNNVVITKAQGHLQGMPEN